MLKKYNQPADNINKPIALNKDASMHKHINLQSQTHTNMGVNMADVPLAPTGVTSKE